MFEIFHFFQNSFPYQIAKKIQLFIHHFGFFSFHFFPFFFSYGLGSQKISKFLVEFLELFFGKSCVFHVKKIKKEKEAKIMLPFHVNLRKKIISSCLPSRLSVLATWSWHRPEWVCPLPLLLFWQPV